MDYRIENKKAFKLLAKVEEQFVDDVKISVFWEKCRNDGTTEELRRRSSHEDKLLIGFADGSSFNGKSYLYYIGTPFEGDAVPDGYAIKEVPEKTWAVFRCTNLCDKPTNEVMFNKIYSEFFPAAEYEPTQEYQLEVWPDDGHHHPDEAAEVWISVKKRRV